MKGFEYTMKAHPTTYAGVNFRSRLEARWAAFFDCMGVRWDYEPCDFAGWTPDFRLDERGCPPAFAEIKPVGDERVLHDYARRAATLAGEGVQVVCAGSHPLRHFYDPDLCTAWRDAKGNHTFIDYRRAERWWREAGNRVQWKAPA